LDRTKNYTWIRVSTIGVRPKPPRPSKLKKARVRKVHVKPAETIQQRAPIQEEAMEIKEAAEPPQIQEVKPIEPKKVEIRVTDERLPFYSRLGGRLWSFDASKFSNIVQLRHHVNYIGLLILTISIVGAVSVTGFLQSTESISSSGILIQTISPPPPLPEPPTPPEPKIEIDVYLDSECTTRLTEVEWGQIEAGSMVERVMYINNSGEVGVFLSLLTDNWNPASAAEHITLTWDYDGNPIDPKGILEVTLKIEVGASIPITGGFIFDIIFIGSAI